MTLILPRTQLAEIIAHAQDQPDEEVCGVLGGQANRVQRLYRARNVAESRRVRFEMHPADILNALRQLEDEGLELVGFYHSHTHTQAYPSPTDEKIWSETWRTEALCLICSLMEPEQPVVRAFRIDEHRHIEEVPIQVVDG